VLPEDAVSELDGVARMAGLDKPVAIHQR
jgi:hypothetical protein